MKAKGSLSPNAAAIIAKMLAPVVQRAAESEAGDVKQNVSRGSRSGVKYASLPYQSSASGEFPQQQSSEDEALVNSIEANPTNNPLVWRVGAFGQPQGKLNWLEYRGRSFLQTTMDDNESRKKALEAARKG